MLNKIEKSLVFAIVILAILCLIMTPKNGHPEIYDTTIDLRQINTTVKSIDIDTDKVDSVDKRNAANINNQLKPGECKMKKCPDAEKCACKDACKHIDSHEENEHCQASSYCPACVDTKTMSIENNKE